MVLTIKLVSIIFFNKRFCGLDIAFNHGTTIYSFLTAYFLASLVICNTCFSNFVFNYANLLYLLARHLLLVVLWSLF